MINNDGGFDFTFTIADFLTRNVFVECDTSIHPTDPGVIIGLYSNEITVSRRESKTIVERIPFIRSIGTYRYVFHDRFVTFYFNGAWIGTVAFMYASHPDNENVFIKTSATALDEDPDVALVSYCLTELSDWREAIFVDLESSPMSGLQSVIQQRPIEIIPGGNNEVKFMYEPETRPIVNAEFVGTIQRTTQENQIACSDAIVYYSDVKVIVNAAAAKRVGFVTRVYRLPDLTNGAMRAGRAMQKKALEQIENTKITGRPNLSVELSDAYHYDTITTGTNVHEVGTVIVESVELSIATEEKSKQTMMTITGREVIE